MGNASKLPDLCQHGIRNPGPVHWNLAPATLTEMALARQEGLMASSGALVVRTGSRTGRSPKDKFTVADPSVVDEVWWGPINKQLAPEKFAALLAKALGFTQGRELFVFDGWAGADPRYRLPVRIITLKAWHSLFAHTLFRRPTTEELANFQPQFTVLDICDYHADPKVDGTNNEICVGLSFERKTVLITGTAYAGEMKKSIFSVLNFLLPQQDVFPMHCSANIGAAGDTALFFGLSGTGKTTLSADPSRRLIGDDEHGWSADGVFNFEGGCYAKTIRLSKAGEPQIWNAIRFGSVLENVVIDPATREADYDSASITENTRCTYPVEYIDNCEQSGRGGHPTNVIFLTCDAFGVLPPLSKLTHEQAVFHFLSGYTAKVAGTEAGVTEPEATFSPCFGGPFLPLHPRRYGAMLQDRLQKHGSQVWLVNTGWISGPAGKASRIKLSHTRALLNAVLNGALKDVPFATEPIFGLAVPHHCPDVPNEVLTPRNLWSNPQEYDQRAKELAERFKKNMSTLGETASTEG